MSVALPLRFALRKTLRVIRFILIYFPQLCRIYWGLILSRSFRSEIKHDNSSEHLQRIQAYFGPLYIITNDPGIRAVRKYGYYDLTLTAALERYLRPGMTMIDVGANIGYFAALAAKRTKSPVLCVEPDPRCIEALTRNKELYPELRIFPYLASNQCGKESFILDTLSTGNSSIAPSAIGTTVQVEAATLDSLVGESRVDVMVIDAQGAEPKIFAGSQKVLQQLSLIFFEFWPYGLKLAGFKPEDLLSFLRSRGFALSHFFPSFHPSPEHPTELISSLELQDRGMGFCNLLASKVI